MTAAIFCIGTELTRGELLNGNATWLADSLTGLGHEVTELACVDDDASRIEAALRRLGSEHELVVCTGGLGPTTDDITTECMARVLSVPLVRDEDSLEQIRLRLLRFNRNLLPSNAKQADFPAGARILPNPNGTAPGFAVKLGRALFCFTPGVPSEMRAMFEASIRPLAVPLVRAARTQLVLRTYGMPESEANDRLKGLEAEHGVVIGYRASLPEIEIKVLAVAESAEQALEKAERAQRAARERLGDAVYDEGFGSLPATVARLLGEKGRSLALAESCTGGLVAELMTRNPGSSRYFRGGVVAYANSAKSALLGVPEDLLVAHGAVSAEVAEQMAQGVRTKLGASFALAFTGIAGPDGGSAEKPVGLVHVALASAAGTLCEQRVFTGSRTEIQLRAAYFGLNLLRRSLVALG